MKRVDNHSALSLIEESELKSLVQSEFPNEVEVNRNIVEDIEIIPPIMTFVDAYEGKEFCKRLTLKNIGSKMASIRIGAPTAISFKLQPMKRVCRLPPGLTLSRMIRMKYSRGFTIHDAQVPIFINNTTVLYPLSIFLNQAKIIVAPLEVNFGRIDAVSSVAAKKVVVKNVGTKNTAFCIDLGRNELELIVEPTKGVLQASEAVTFKLEVMGFYEGPFEKEFWIKTAPPKRVTVVGEFITPKIISTYPRAYTDFSMVIFPRVYIGQTATRTLMVKNISSCDAMFCIKGIIRKKFLLYKEAAQENEHYRCFRVNPLEGRIGSQQTTVVEITYEPLKTSENHAVCFIQVIRVDCTDVDDSVVIKVTEGTEITAMGQDRSRSSLMTIASSMPGAPQDDYDEADDPRIENLVTEEKISDCESFRVCLYGDKEPAQVNIRPKNIHMNQIQVDEIYLREITLENSSSYLPINIVYTKVAFIDIQPPKIYLKPNERKEVIAKIQTKRAGYYCGKAKFDLVVYEEYDIMHKKQKVVVGSLEIKVTFEGVLTKVTPKTKFITKITPDNLNEVGFMTHDIKFNTKVPKMKSAVIREDDDVFREDDSALIAFPNDRPQSLRPWTKKKPCKTIFAKIPRNITTHDEYSFSPKVLLIRKDNRDFYLKYLRDRQNKAGTPKAKKSQDYTVTRKWMFARYLCENFPDTPPKVSMTGFVPLSPILLHNIKISPRYIRLQRVAPISNVEHQFTIFNDNPFTLFIYVTSVKSGIYFPQGNCKIVNPHEMKVMSLTCFAGLVGRYINLIQVVVNFCHLYTISVMVEVVPKMINLDENVLNFEPEITGNIKFIQLQNHLNSSISFSTEMSMSRFSIQPPSGTILQKRALLCAIQYNNLPETPDYCELVLTSEGGGSQILQISRKKERPILEMNPPRLNLPNLPLNLQTTHTLRVRNIMNYDICYIVVDPSPAQGVDIFPFEGVIEALAELEYFITININYTETFDTKFEFIFEDQFSFIVPVHGQVIIPTIDLRPETIVNRQLMPFAYRRNIFFVKNESICDCVVRFDLDTYEYFRVTEKEEDMDTTIHNTNLKLLPGEAKMLYLHFQPMDALTESFYLPVIVNDMIGPPFMSNLESMHFKLAGKHCHTDVKLPCLKITSICSTICLHFSTLRLSFTYALSDLNTDQLTKFFTVKNLGNEVVEFCIRTDKPISQFSLGYHSGVNVDDTKYSLVCKLRPSESTIFVVKFLPSSPGKFLNNLPIYVRNYLDGCIFNYLKLVGTYESPLLTTDKTTYYIGCTPVGFKSVVMLDIHMYYHDANCQVSFDLPPEDITVTHRERAGRKSRNVTKIKIHFLPPQPISYFEDITFYCSCDATCTIKLICFSDNYFLSHFAFFATNKNFIRETLILPAKNFEFLTFTCTRPGHTDTKANTANPFAKYLDLSEYPENENNLNFPYFPLETVEGEHVHHKNLRKTLKFVERWIYSQGFYKKQYFRIPYTIALAPIIQSKDFKKDTLIVPTILTFLVELAGEKVKEASITSKVSVFNQKNIALHFMITYGNMLQYLKDKGAIMPHVLPEFLLTYEFYRIICTYCPNLLNIKGTLERKEFHAYSARCYLDLILQSIKLFILNRLKMFDVDIRPPSSEEIDTDERLSAISTITPISCQITIMKPNNSIYSSYEHILLYWLQYHFDYQKNRLWKTLLSDGLTTLPPKEIKLFDENLNDSLVFACVTFAYCPYLQSYLKDMFVPPSTFEEYHHNACTIIKTWNLLKLSFTVEPDDIVNPNGINMFLLTLYLFEILPSFFPKEVLTFEAKLTQESKANINLTNFSDHPILYAITFFSNDSGSFAAESDVFSLQPKKVGTMMITYQAKKISSQKAILVLSGELPGQKYGRSRAIYLNGITDLNYCVKTVEVKSECYKIERMKIKLLSPYKVPDTYEIFYAVTYSDTTSQDELELFSWKEYVLGRVPKRIFTKEYQFVIKDPEEGFYFEPIICCQMTAVKIFKMFMVGQHGDWCFEIKTIPKMSKTTHEVINVSLPRGFNSQVCSCKEKSSDIPLICPRTIHINIPSKNNLYFKSTKEMFIACTDEQFLAFWKKYLPTRTVMNIIKELFALTDLFKTPSNEYDEFRSQQRVYSIIPEANAPFTAQKEVVIDDITSDRNVEILIHSNSDSNSSSVVSSILQLETSSGMWRRYYKVNFYES